MPNEFPAQDHRRHHGPPWPSHQLRHPLRHRAGGAASAPDHVTVRLPREDTFDNAARIGHKLQEALSSGPRVLEVDLARVTYLSSDGVEAFFMAFVAAKPHGS